jgi:predicted GNAT family N-acyltransferase
MSARAFAVVDADYARDLAKLRAVREPVFVHEQRVPIDLEWDELDPLSEHVLALDADGVAIGTGRLTPARKIGRMAVLAAWRGHGVGAALLVRLLERARRLGYPRVELHAQVDAIGFYARHGFVAYGERFEEAGIQHQSMRLDLAGLAGAGAAGPDRAGPA